MSKETYLARPLRLGVIGAGGVAQSSHFPALIRLRQSNWPISVVAIADSSPERIIAAQRILTPLEVMNSIACRTYSDGATLLAADGVDAVLILTPPTQTVVLLEQALRLGIPALAEKPGATNSQALARLVELEKAPTGPMVRIAYNRHSMPLAMPFRNRLNEIRKQAIPNTLHVEARLWRANRGDAIFYEDTMVHALDFLLWCLGPLAIQQVKWWSPHIVGGLPAGLHVDLQTREGDVPLVTAHLDVRPAIGRDLESYEVFGDKESLKLLYPPVGATAKAELLLYENGKTMSLADSEGEVSEDGSDGLTERGFLPQLAHFLQIVAGYKSNAESLSTLTQAYNTAFLKEEIHNYVHTNRR